MNDQQQQEDQHAEQIAAVIDKGLEGIRDIARTMVFGGLKNLSRRDLEKFVQYVAAQKDTEKRLSWWDRFKRRVGIGR